MYIHYSYVLVIVVCWFIHACLVWHLASHPSKLKTWFDCHCHHYFVGINCPLSIIIIFLFFLFCIKFMMIYEYHIESTISISGAKLKMSF